MQISRVHREKYVSKSKKKVIRKLSIDQLFAQFVNWRIAEEIRNSIMQQLNIAVNHMLSEEVTARRNNALINWKENMVNHKNLQIRLDIPATLKTHENRSAYSKMVNRRGILNTLVNMYLLISVFSFNLIILSFDWLENPWLDLVRHLDDLCLFVFY